MCVLVVFQHAFYSACTIFVEVWACLLFLVIPLAGNWGLLYEPCFVLFFCFFLSSSVPKRKGGQPIKSRLAYTGINMVHLSKTTFQHWDPMFVVYTFTFPSSVFFAWVPEHFFMIVAMLMAIKFWYLYLWGDYAARLSFSSVITVPLLCWAMFLTGACYTFLHPSGFDLPVLLTQNQACDA